MELSALAGAAVPAPACIPLKHVLVDPEPAKWQPVPSDAPIYLQVARFVALPSVHIVAARGKITPSQLASMHAWVLGLLSAVFLLLIKLQWLVLISDGDS